MYRVGPSRRTEKVGIDKVQNYATRLRKGRVRLSPRDQVTVCASIKNKVAVSKKKIKLMSSRTHIHGEWKTGKGERRSGGMAHGWRRSLRTSVARALPRSTHKSPAMPSQGSKPFGQELT